MDFQTNTQEPLRHRHILALPLLLLAFGTIVTVRSILGTDTAAAATGPVLRMTDIEATAPRVYQVPTGLRAELTEGTFLRDQWGTLELFQGTAFVSGPVSIQLQVGDIGFHGFHGAFQVSASATTDDITVYAVSTPVLIEQADTKVFLPAATKVTFGDSKDAADITPIPEQMLRDLLLRAKNATATDTTPVPGRDAKLERMIIATKSTPSAVAELVPLMTDPSTWLLLSFHPDFREALWSVPGPRDTPIAVRRTRWLLFASPHTGTRTAISIRRFGEEVQKFLMQEEGAQSFAEDLLLRLTELKTVSGNEEVETLTLLRQALEPAFQSMPEGLLSASAQAQWQEFMSHQKILPYVEPEAEILPVEPAQESVTEEMPEEASDPLTATDIATASALARDVLSQNGALFTGQTDITVTGKTEVTVTDVLFADGTGEHTYAFRLNLDSLQVQNIERDKELLPYYLPLENFANWARGM